RRSGWAHGWLRSPMHTRSVTELPEGRPVSSKAAIKVGRSLTFSLPGSSPWPPLPAPSLAADAARSPCSRGFPASVASLRWARGSSSLKQDIVFLALFLIGLEMSSDRHAPH